MQYIVGMEQIETVLQEDLQPPVDTESTIELVTPVLDEFLTVENSGLADTAETSVKSARVVDNSLPAQMRRAFVKSLKPSPYILDCSTITDEDFWHSIHPPIVAECP